MRPRSAHVVGAVGTLALFAAIQLFALALTQPFQAAGYQTVEDPSNPSNSLVYLIAVLAGTAILLVVIKLGAEQLLRVFVVAIAALLAYYAFSVATPLLIPSAPPESTPVLFAVALAIVLYGYPEWYVIDAAGVVIGASSAALFGISFEPLPAILFLVVLAVYDAVSVYRTKHMLTLAASVTELKLPLILIVPLSGSYSFLHAEPPAELPDSETKELPPETPTATTNDRDDAREPAAGSESREAFYLGLGDAVMPTLLAVSATAFTPAAPLGVPGIALNLPALTTIIGTLLGLSVLLWLVSRGRPHAGLPLLNGGAIGGFLVGLSLANIPVSTALAGLPA